MCLLTTKEEFPYHHTRLKGISALLSERATKTAATQRAQPCIFITKRAALHSCANVRKIKKMPNSAAKTL